MDLLRISPTLPDPFLRFVRIVQKWRCKESVTKPVQVLAESSYHAEITSIKLSLSFILHELLQQFLVLCHLAVP